MTVVIVPWPDIDVCSNWLETLALLSTFLSGLYLHGVLRVIIMLIGFVVVVVVMLVGETALLGYYDMHGICWLRLTDIVFLILRICIFVKLIMALLGMHRMLGVIAGYNVIGFVRRFVDRASTALWPLRPFWTYTIGISVALVVARMV